MPTSPTVRRRRLAAELRRLRSAADLTIAQVAKRMDCTHPKISRIENGHRAASLADVHMLLSIYGVTGHEAERLMALAKDSRKRGWWHTYRNLLPEWYETYVGLEAEAASIHTYEGEVIPGLLQTADYARALTRATLITANDEDIERRAELRIQRQQRLTGPEPVELWAVISEATLRRPVGGTAVHVAQLVHLAKMSELRHVMVQVMPFAAGAHPAMAGMFTILRFPEHSDQDAVYLETQVGGLYLEELTEVEHYARMMDHLRAMAADPARSRTMIRQIEREFAHER
ncbi:MAG: helix-turn-helix domain-containing protein [Pseudonocardiaceae bacterium]